MGRVLAMCLRSTVRRGIVLCCRSAALLTAFCFVAYTSGADAGQSDVPTVATVKSDTAPLRAAPNADTAPRSVVLKGATFTLLRIEGEWLRVDEGGGRVGYLEARHADVGRAKAASLQAVATIRADSAAVRSAPDPNGSIRSVVLKGARFPVLQVEGQWLRINDGGRVGYIEAAHAAITQVLAPQPDAPVAPARPTQATAPTGQGAACDDKPTNVSYIFPASTPLLQQPKLSSARVGIAPMNAVAVVTCAVEGHLRVMLSGKDDIRGWFAATKKDVEENMLPEGILEPMLRKIAMEDKPWPAAVKAAILRKRVRVGFTPEQVTAALKQPLRRESEETAVGVTEVWTYLDQTVTFKADRVTSIRRRQ